MDERLRANRDRWDELVDIHAASEFYGVAEFMAGQSRLDALELDWLGDIRGKAVAHIQCHFGLSSLSMVRMGAQVTGLDFSPRAIAKAQELAHQAGLVAEFVECDICDPPSHLHGLFDIAFATYGVLCWQPDLKPWANGIASLLKAGGRVIVIDGHPTSCMMEGASLAQLRPVYPYFEGGGPVRFENEGDYADPTAAVKNRVAWEWSHSLSELFSALRSAGFAVDRFEEYPYICWEAFPFLTRGEDGFWRVAGNEAAIPLMFGMGGILESER